MKEDGTPTGLLFSPEKLPMSELDLIKIELLNESVPQKSLNNEDCCQDNKFLSTKWHQVHITEDNTHTPH